MKAPKGVISAYARRINREVITLEDVPEDIRDEVAIEAEKLKAS